MSWFLIATYCLLLLLFLFCCFILFNNMLLFGILFVDYSVRSYTAPKDYPPASAWRYIKNFWREMWYVFGKYYLLPLKWCNFTVKGKKNDTVILLIHGYCRSQTDWYWMRKQFKATNLPVYCVNLEPMFGSIQELASNKVVDKIKLIKQQTNCKNIIIIGHSMGGIVGSYYSEYLDNAKLIKAVITIASPFSGTKVSMFAKGDNAKEMCPGSSFLTELRIAIDKTPSKYYQICSKFDNIIFPWQSSLLSSCPSENQLVLPFAGHLTLIHMKEIAAQLSTWIKKLS